MHLDRRRALVAIAAALPLAGRDEAAAQGQGAIVPPAPQPAPPPLPPIPSLSISPQTAAKVGRQVWINESGGSTDGLTAWNAGEDFPSLGIGHWIWFKEGGHPQFEESFPKLVAFIRANGPKPPAWLDRQPVPPCPWRSKAEFEREFRSAKLNELRQFLVDSIPQQTQYLLARAGVATPGMLDTLPAQKDKRHVLTQLNRVVRSSPDLYPVIDYVNFKGEGISEKETVFDPPSGRRQGWGFKYLLLEMKGTEEGAAALEEFSRAAKYVLDRRIRNHPQSQRWRLGWHKRCDTYRRPLA